MDLADMMMGQSADTGDEVKGVAVAVVTNNQDPENLGRVKVKYPWRAIEDESYWARITTFMAGNDMGGYFLPEVNDEVLVAFENGDIDHPIILGSLWSGKLKPPEKNASGKNDRRLIKSRSGHQVILDDTAGSEKIDIIDKSGRNLITIKTSSNTIEITSAQDIILKAQGKISLECSQLEFKARATAKLESSGNMDLKATGIATLKGGIVMINS
jgi:uncharacterized protein involved in type VI secretion and phage assembly